MSVAFAHFSRSGALRDRTDISFADTLFVLGLGFLDDLRMLNAADGSCCYYLAGVKHALECRTFLALSDQLL